MSVGYPVFNECPVRLDDWIAGGIHLSPALLIAVEHLFYSMLSILTKDDV